MSGMARGAVSLHGKHPFQYFVRIENIIDDFNTGFFFKVGHRVRGDIIRPVIEGKYPQRCPRAKVEEPSARMMTEAMYFS